MKKIFAAMTAALLISALGSSAVFAAKATSTWKLYSFNTSGQALRSQQVAVTNGAASFTFPTAPDAAYLLSSGVPSIIAGNLQVNVGIAAPDGTTFAYYPTPNAPARVGLYFETKAAGAFNPSDYWWSGSSRVDLTTLVNTTDPTQLAAALIGANWTNFYGQRGDQPGPYTVNDVTYPSAEAGFNAAVTHISSWGVSFGGGSFFANGVGTPTGSAVFTLTP